MESTRANDEVLVRVEGVSKKFCRSLKKSLWYGLCDIAGELSPFAKHGAEGMEQGGQDRGRRSEDGGQKAGGGLRDGEFWAVNDVSFELRRGECLGLIGHNGAGKTTLLKMLNGLIKPDAGKITMRGRVGALIALGAGFNPILTGRENIYINGSVLGLSKKEIDGKIDEIIDFAEIGEFIDSPVMNYSSGMNVRLGFSVAANLLSPDVLILDEIMAVGDDNFRMKCLDRISRLLSSGVAMIIVTHQMMNVERSCTRCNVMAHGRTVLATSNVQEAIRTYLGMEGGSGGGMELVYGPDSYLTVDKVNYDPASYSVVITYNTAFDEPRSLFVTYRVILGGNEILKSSTRDNGQLLASPSKRCMVVKLPPELPRLGELKLYLALYDSEARKPLVLIKEFPVPADSNNPYRFDFASVESPSC